MPYIAGKDPTNGVRSLVSPQWSQRVVSPSDTDDLDPYARIIEVVAEGNVVYIPAKNADDAPITVTGAPVGWRSPVMVRRVKSSGTTATVVTVD